MLPSNIGLPWTLEEEKRLYEETGSDTPVAAIAAAHGRTTGGIRSRQRQMGLRDKNGRLVFPLPPFQSYLRPKPERLKRERRSRPDEPSPQQNPVSSTVPPAAGDAPGEKQNPAQPVQPVTWPPELLHDGTLIEKLWRALRHDIETMLRDGRKCEAIAERAIAIALARLTPGDEIHPYCKLEELGDRYGVSRERIRQVQGQVMRRLILRVQRDISLTAQVLTDIADDVPDEQVQTPHSWFGAELARQGCRPAFIEFMLIAFLRHHAFLPREARRLTEQAMPSLLQIRRAESAKQGRYAANGDVPKRVLRANDFVLGILKKAVWPDRLSGRPLDLTGFPPLRDCKNEQSYYSKTLRRLVGFDSGGERRLIRALDVSSLVTQFAEQPVEIDYRLDGADRIYIPDILVRTDTDLHFVIEIKAHQQLAARTTLAKAEAAVSHLGGRGIGYCLTDADGFGLEDLRELEPDAEFRRRLNALLRRHRTVTRKVVEEEFGREKQRWTYDQLQNAVLREGLRYDTRLVPHPQAARRYVFDFRLRAG